MPELVCPNCGAEYKAGITECADCLIELVDPSTIVPEDPLIHETVTYEIAEWPKVKYDVLQLRLGRDDIPFEFTYGNLIVPTAHEAAVDALIDELDAEDIEDEPEQAVPREAEPEGSPPSGDPTGGLGRRVGAGVVDALLTSLTFSFLGSILLNLDSWRRDDLDRVWLVTSVVVFLYEVVCVGRWGQTVGKRVAGIRVVVLNDRPVWVAAILRAGVPIALYGLGSLPGADTPVRLVGLVWTLAVYLPIVVRGDHRGAHDLIASTMVVRA